MFSFSYENRTYNLDLPYKLCVVMADSATGKTSMIEDVHMMNLDGYLDVFACYNEATYLIIPEETKLVIADEEYVRRLCSDHLLKDFIDSTKHILLITRLPIKYLNYSHKCVFELKCENLTYTLSRLYDDYNYLDGDPDFVEDSNAGLSYYKQFFPKVKTTNGKNNIRHEASVGSYVVADGCSIGHEMYNLYTRYKLFLPESFEWLLLRRHGVLPSVVPSYNTERHYTSEAIRKLPYGYNKTRFNHAYTSRDYIADFEIPDEVLNLAILENNSSATVKELRKIIYNIQGQHTVDEVVKLALVLFELNRLQ